MDFGSLIYAAHKNEKTANKEVKYYTTKFEPPKKVNKSKTSLSVNVQKYLQKRDEEERRKVEEEKKKKEELLALRSQDRKAYKRVQTMLKRTKSANMSVMEDAIDDVNTVVTMAGPQQCDEDDYGYVSQEASALYAKLMDKYASMPPEEPKFPQGKKPVIKDLNAAKDRVKAALLKHEEEEMMPHKRKRKSKADKLAEEGVEGEFEEQEQRSREPSPVEPSKPKKPKKMAPPPMDFSSLLKLAEQKQFEPIKIEKKVDEEEDKRPMTKKQRLEYELERERRERKMERESALRNGQRKPDSLNRIPKLSEKGERNEKLNGLERIPKKTPPESKLKSVSFSDGSRKKESIDSDSNSRTYSVNDHARSREKPNGLERIPKKTPSESRLKSDSFSEGSRRKDSIDSDSNSRTYSVNDRPRSREKPNELERIPKKSLLESRLKCDSFSEGSRRKDSIDSDSNSHTYSDNDRPRSQSQYKSNRPVSRYQSDSDPPRNNYESDSDRVRSSHHIKRENTKRNEERKPLKPAQTSVAVNKIKSRIHNISDDEQSEVSDNRYERSQSKTHRPEHKSVMSSSLKQGTPKYSKDLNRSYSERNDYEERDSKSTDDEYSDSQSGSDSKKYYSESTVYKNRPVKYKPEKRSRSSSDSEPEDRKTYELPKKPNASWSKEKKIKSLFAGSDEEDSDYNNHVRRDEVETKKPRPSPSCKSDAKKTAISESKFRIPKENSKPNLNKTNIHENIEKHRSSESNRSSSSSKSQINKDPGKHTPNSSHQANSSYASSKPIMDKDRLAVDKKMEKPRPPNIPPKTESSSENTKQLPSQSAEETLKKSGNVWSKPCNLPPSKPNSGLSESQIQRLREMNKKPTPINSKSVEGHFRQTFSENKSISKPISRDERQIPPRTFQGKPSLLKAAAAAAASRAASQKTQSSTTSRDLERQQPPKSSERPSSKSSERPLSKSSDRLPSKPSERPPLKLSERPTLKPSERPPSKSSEIPPSKSYDRQPLQKSLSSAPSKQRELASKDLRPKQFPPSDLKPKQFPPNDLKPRQFPPKDVRGRQFPPADVKRKPKPRRIETDSEDEYDSEMDDFIDRGDDLDDEEISREIQSIFGYDKSRYDGLDDDDECMESNFGQIDKEEMTSLRIGAIEDYKELMKEKKERERKKKRKLEMMRMMKERR